MKKRQSAPIVFCTIAFLFVTGGIVSAQQLKEIDSLKRLIQNSPEDSSAVNLYYGLGRQYEYFKSKERIEYFIVALDIARQINFVPGIKKVSMGLITNLFHRNMYDLSLQYALSYLSYLEKNGLVKDQKKLCNIMGNLYAKQGVYDLSMKYYTRAKNYYREIKDTIQYANVLTNMSILMSDYKMMDSALFYSIQSVELYRTSNSPSYLANALLNVASLTAGKKNFDTSKKAAREAGSLYDSLGEEHGKCNTFIVLADIYTAENRKDSALVYLKAAEKSSKRLNIPALKSELFLKFSLVYAGTGNFEEAYRYHLLYKQNDDSIAMAGLKEKMMELEAKYDIGKKENMLRQNKLELEINRKQKNILALVIIGILVLLAGALNAYIQKNRSNKIIAAQKRKVDEKQKEILDSIRYAKRIQSSLLPSDTYIERKLDELKKGSQSDI